MQPEFPAEVDQTPQNLSPVFSEYHVSFSLFSWNPFTHANKYLLSMQFQPPVRNDRVFGGPSNIQELVSSDVVPFGAGSLPIYSALLALESSATVDWSQPQTAGVAPAPHAEQDLVWPPREDDPAFFPPGNTQQNPLVWDVASPPTNGVAPHFNAATDAASLRLGGQTGPAATVPAADPADLLSEFTNGS